MTTCTTCARKRVEYLGRTKIVFMQMSLVSGDTIVTVATGLRNILSWTVSPYTLTTKLLLHATESGGTITQNVTDPAANETLKFTVWGN